ncbi:hypothetical protein [uncultured Wocania sp.]|uniref:hypothetical protein n=1 Tax=uncultured Wocania sp. TaxID=2834404 RepID=UPI0030F5C938
MDKLLNKIIKSKTLILSVFMAGFLSCKDVKVENSECIIVEVILIMQKNDTLELFYNSRKNESFMAKKSLRKPINGSTSEQKIKFVLEQGIYPTRLRLDLGENQNQKEILIKNITLKYNNGNHEFSNLELEKYFKPSKYFNFENLRGKPMVIDRKYDPYLESYNISKFINKLILN